MSDRIAEIRARHRRGMKGLTQTHHDRAALLAEIERLREENRHHRVTTTNSVSKSLHDAAIAEQAAEIARLRAALEEIARGDYSDPMCQRTPEAQARAALEGGR